MATSVDQPHERTSLLRGDEEAPHLSQSSSSSSHPDVQDGDAHPGSSSCQSSSSGDDNDEIAAPIANISSTRLALMLFAGNIGALIAAIDHMILTLLLGPISADLASFAVFPYLASSYLAFLAPCAAISGRLSDVFGRGPMLALAFVVIGIASLVCGLAPAKTHPDDPNLRGVAILVAGRALAGLGTGPAAVTVHLLNADLVPERSRSLFVGISGAMWGLGSIVGTALGGILGTQSGSGWRMAFILHAPVCALMAPLAWWSINVPAKTSRSGKSTWQRIDLAGAGLIIAWFILLVGPINAGGVIVPWSHPAIWACVGASVVVLVALVRVEMRARYPVVPIAMILDGTMMSSCWLSFSSTMLHNLAMWFAPLFFQVMLGDSVIQAGLRALPLAVGHMVANLFGGYVIKRTGRYKPVGIVAWLGVVVGFVISSLVSTPGTTTNPTATTAVLWLAAVGPMLMGAGTAPNHAITQLSTAAGLAKAKREEQLAPALATLQMIRELGAALGLALTGAVMENIVRARLWDRFGLADGDDDDATRVKIEQILRIVLRGEWEGLGWPKGEVLEAFGDGFGAVWWIGAVVALVSLVVVARMREYRLRTTLG